VQNTNNEAYNYILITDLMDCQGLTRVR